LFFWEKRKNKSDEQTLSKEEFIQLVYYINKTSNFTYITWKFFSIKLNFSCLKIKLKREFFSYLLFFSWAKLSATALPAKFVGKN
jgi:hypothetical protein